MTDFFKTHPFMKALSLVLACFLWLSVRGEQQIEKSMQVRVKIVNLPTDLVTTEEIEPSITLHIEGPRTRIAKIDEEAFHPYTIDLNDARRGVNTVWVSEEDFQIPRGTRITQVSPQRIRITLDRAEERLVEIEPRFVGELEQGYELIGYEAEPKFLKVRGARGELAGLTSIRTEPISLTGRDSNFESDVMVRGRGLSWELEGHTVRIKVKVQSMSKKRNRAS